LTNLEAFVFGLAISVAPSLFAGTTSSVAARVMGPTRLTHLLSLLVLPAVTLQYSLPLASPVLGGHVARPLAPSCCAAAAQFSAAPTRLRPSAARRHAPLTASLASLALANGPLVAAGIGGTFAGSLHAVTGPDHLAALLPLAIGRRWWQACYTGLYWGMGHGIGAALVGFLAFMVRGALNLDALCGYMEAAVGLSIMIIGVNGVREAREWQEEADAAAALAEVEAAVAAGAGSAIDGTASGALMPKGSDVEMDAVPAYGLVSALSQAPKKQSVSSTLITGILHGCSGSGHLLGVLPALAMPSMTCALTYLSAFGLGTMIAMSSFTAIVGELSVQMGERLQSPDVPAKLAFGTSLFACVMGFGWTFKALLELGAFKYLFGIGRRLLAV